MESKTDERHQRFKFFDSGIEYSVRSLLYLADCADLCTAPKIARGASVPQGYFIQLAQALRDQGILKTAPGKAGGYALAKPPEEITLFEIVCAVQFSRKAKSRAARPKTRCDTGVLENVEKRIAELLDKTTLADLKLGVEAASEREEGREF